MAQQLASQPTTPALGNAWHFICNALYKALDNATQTTPGRLRAFDTIIIGDSLGALTAANCLSTLQRMVAVFCYRGEAIVLPEHVQSMSFKGVKS